jgi:transposase-like protein
VTNVSGLLTACLPAERGHRKLLAFDGGKRAMTKVKLERWRAHLQAARDRGGSLARYAREHGLSRHTLYAAQRQWRGEQLAAGKRSSRRASPSVSKASPFVRVELARPAALLRARLPNGVELEFGNVEPSGCPALIEMLAALPCSG